MKEDVRLALIWLAEDTSRTSYKAAKLFKIAQSTLTRAMVKDGAMVRCEDCGYEHYDPSKVVFLPKKKNGRIDMKLVIGKK